MNTLNRGTSQKQQMVRHMNTEDNRGDRSKNHSRKQLHNPIDLPISPRLQEAPNKMEQISSKIHEMTQKQTCQLLKKNHIMFINDKFQEEVHKQV